MNTLWGTKARKREPSGSLLAPKDVEFGSFGAPKVLKMDPLGTPLGRQIGILEPVGNIVQPAVDLVSFWVHFGDHFRAPWDQIWLIFDAKMDERRTNTHAQNPSGKTTCFQQ